MSATVRKQWDTIRNNPELKKKNFDRLKQQTINRWANMSDEDRDKFIKSLTSSNNCDRSKGSDLLKEEMINNGLYDGFVSEEIFHGFIPDEINHNLKIIIEYYGDIYHCNPNRYKDNNEYLKFIGRTVGEQRKRDSIRIATFYRHGYSVVIVWESDFKKDKSIEIRRIKDEIDKKRETNKDL
jgi:G:T-mismatch repair DNA endonuclease (very short patch repair protein)